jgi:RNA recognition motif-containing protein
MPSNLFVGGFPFEATQDEVARFFSSCGKVSRVKILTHRDTGRSRGIGFVLMSSDAEGDAAIAKLNGAMFGERKIFVTEAKPPEKREPGAAAPSGPAAAPDFVERRSGKDRRRQPVGPWDPNERRLNAGAERGAAPAAGEKRWEKKPAFGAERKWVKKPGAFGAEKKWDKKPGAFSGEKKWEKKPGAFSGEKKWDKKPGGFGGKKPWDKKPGGFGDKKPWEKKPGGFGGDKKWDKKPGGFRKGGGGRGA